MRKVLLVLVVSMFAATASAVVLVNVDSSTTVGPWGGDSNGDDAFFARAEAFGNLNNDLGEAHPGNEGAELSLTVNAVSDLEGLGLYNVYVHYATIYVPGHATFGVHTASGIEASLIDNQNYFGYDGTDGTIIADGNPWFLREVLLGQVAATSGAPDITVYLRSGGVVNITYQERTLADAVKFELVPESTTVVLLGFGALTLIRRRRSC